MLQLSEQCKGSPRTATVDRDLSREYLTFRLGSTEYGVDILKVQEIRGYDSVTAIANAPAFIKGVVNLRGLIVPILDMRIKFQVGEVRYDEFTVVIILNVGGRVVGIVVDSVSDVRMLQAGDIKPAPAIATSLGTDFIIGIGTVEDRMLILIDIERLMASATMALHNQLLQ